MEEEINHYNSRLEMMQVNLKCACDELEKKDNLLREKITKEVKETILTLHHLSISISNYSGL